MDKTATPSKRQRLTTILFLFVGLVALFLIASLFSKELQMIGDLIRSAGWLGWLISILIFGVLGATPIPSEPVTVLITTIFGPLAAAVITTFGNLTAAMVEYLIGHQVGGVIDFQDKRQKLPFGLSKVPVESPLFLLSVRMLPGYGPKFISVTSGVYHVPFGRYLWTTALSTALGAMIVAFGGYGILTTFLHK